LKVFSPRAARASKRQLPRGAINLGRLLARAALGRPNAYEESGSLEYLPMWHNSARIDSPEVIKEFRRHFVKFNETCQNAITGIRAMRESGAVAFRWSSCRIGPPNCARAKRRGWMRAPSFRRKRI